VAAVRERAGVRVKRSAGVDATASGRPGRRAVAAAVCAARGTCSEAALNAASHPIIVAFCPVLQNVLSVHACRCTAAWRAVIAPFRKKSNATVQALNTAAMRGLVSVVYC